jgi:cation-transporting ATPase E
MNIPSQGLTSAEVAERRRLGQVNRTPRSEWRAYGNILSRNLLTWFNGMVTPAAIALFYLGEYPAGLAVSGMAIVNSAIGLFQEIQAKRQLDQLALLVESRARVVRDGKVLEIPSGEVVLGDHIRLAAGDSVVADGPVLEAEFLEIDEALLTGESDPVRRKPGEVLLSGSFCVAGEGCYRADKVGAEAFSHHISVEARSYHYAASPLTRIVNMLIQVLSYTALGLGLLYTALFLWPGIPLTRDQDRGLVLMIAATITSMVPQGLVLTATLSFTLGAISMSRKGAIVQRLAAVETMAAIDVICTDKTGTLTTNRLRLDHIRLLTSDQTEDEVREKLRTFSSSSLDRANKNIMALRSALGESAVEVRDQLPFKSQNRYSAVRIGTPESESVLVLGAYEALTGHLHDAAKGCETVWKELLPTGLRLLLFAEAIAPPGGFPAFGPTLGALSLKPLALVCLSDELRPDAGQVLEVLAAQGIAFKVISGDNPETVRATVAHLNLPLAKDPVVTGDQLAAAADPSALARERSVFGRVSPRQKVQIVQLLQEQGCHVAMIGDGVNDVLPIKRADLGIAMGEGSQAAKTVSGLVLENNHFALLPETLEEGRTILRNLRRSSKLFLVKNVYSLVLILACLTGIFGLGFPYRPQQVTLLNWLVIGIPAFVIVLSRERSTAPSRPRFLREVGWFALRTGIAFSLAGLAVLGFSRLLWPLETEKTQRTLLLSTLILLGLTALFRALTDGEDKPLAGDRTFKLLGVVAIPIYLLAVYWPFSAAFFELASLSFPQWLLVLAAAGVGYGLSVVSDRY